MNGLKTQDFSNYPYCLLQITKVNQSHQKKIKYMHRYFKATIET